MSISTVYGPVHSWRLGRSIGIDLLFVDSICSFRCVYCQLGKINVQTMGRRVFVSTERVISDLRASNWQEADVVTFSGSGEPTLAYNLGDAIREVRFFTSKPIIVLTNSTMLGIPSVRQDLCEADRVFCKLDAATDRTLALIGRPMPGITVDGIVKGIGLLRNQFTGHLAVQIMLTRLNLTEVDQFAGQLNRIRPDKVQLNTPLRPTTRMWFRESRGELGVPDIHKIYPRSIPVEELDRAEKRLQVLTGLNISSVYKHELSL
jgi:wyosine [tRNA(Phe)-imidazoG37] synthetase (radical SAM superfamily)